MAIVPKKVAPVAASTPEPEIVARVRTRIPPIAKDNETVLDAPEHHDPKRQGSNWTEDGDYIVGKGRTPTHTRWEKGKSGNPKGRRKAPASVDEAFADYMDDKRQVKTAAGREKIRHQAILIHKVFEIATKGSISAARLMFERADAGRRSRSQTEQYYELSEAERTLLQHLIDHGSLDEGEP